MNREDYKIAYENVMLANKMLEQEIERLNKERNKTYENGLNYFLKLQEKKDEIERLNNIINELEEEIQKEIERTETLIQDDYEHGLGSFGNIRKMLNEERKNWLYKIKELKGEKENE